MPSTTKVQSAFRVMLPSILSLLSSQDFGTMEPSPFTPVSSRIVEIDKYALCQSNTTDGLHRWEWFDNDHDGNMILFCTHCGLQGPITKKDEQ